MEKKNKTTKSKFRNYLSVIVLVFIVLVGLAVVGIKLYSENKEQRESGNEITVNHNFMTSEEAEQVEEILDAMTEEEIAGLKQEADNGVKDELTLRLLLLLDDKIDIKVSSNIEVAAKMPVNGKKRLTGDATINTWVGTTFKDMAILEVNSSSELTVDSVVLDANGVCNVVGVLSGGTFYFKSGVIKYAGLYGIRNQGVVYVSGGEIQDCFVGIAAERKSKTYMSNGKVVDSLKNSVWVAPGGAVDISGGMLDGCYSHGILNQGDLVMTGGKIKNIRGEGPRAIANSSGTTVIDGGSDYVEIYDCAGGLYNTGGKMTVNKVYVHDVSQVFVVLRQGKAKVTNCKFINSALNGISAMYGNVEYDNIYIENVAKYGMRSNTDCVAKVKNVEIVNVGTDGYLNSGGTATLTNVNVKKSGTTAFRCATYDGKVTGLSGPLTMKNCTATDCGSGLGVWYGTTATVSKCVFNKTESTNLSVRSGSTLNITDSRILGTVGGTNNTCSIKDQSIVTLKNCEVADGARGFSIVGNVTMDGGSIHGMKGELPGSAAYIAEGSSLKMNGVKVSDNMNTNTKGMCSGIWVNKNSDATIQNCEFTNNSTITGGGAIYLSRVTDKEIVLKNNIFKNNVCTSTENGDGGAVKVLQSKVLIENCKFEKNEVSRYGGAVRCTEGSTVTIKGNSTFTDNYSVQSGGAVSLSKSNVTIEGALFEFNESATSGACLGVTSTQLDVSNTVFKDNIAKQAGGVMVQSGEGASVFAKNCTAFANKAEYGGVFSFGAGVNIIDGGSYYGNTATSGKDEGSGAGGVLYTTKCETVKIIGGTYKDNKADKYGAVICHGRSKDSVAALTIDGSVFTNNGKADSNKRGSLYGGVISNGNLTKIDGVNYPNSTSSVMIKNAKFKNNKEALDGGAIYQMSKGTVEISGADTLFESNMAAAFGGAVRIYKNGSGDVTVKDGVRFVKNTAANTGGAIYNDGGVLSVSNGVRFDTNEAGTAAAGIYNAGTLHDKGSVFANNKVTGASAGGAIRNYGGTATIEDSQFVGNVTVDAGAAIYTNKPITVTGAIFTDNTASRGAAIYSASAQITVDGCTFSENAAIGKDKQNKDGGAVFAGYGLISNCTFADNIADHGRDIFINANLKNSDLSGTNKFDGKGNNIYLSNNGEIAFSGKSTGLTVVYSQNSPSLKIAGNIAEDSSVVLQPASYVSGVTVVKANDNTENTVNAFAAATKIIKVAEEVKEDQKIVEWYLDELGRMRYQGDEASYSIKIGEQIYATLEAAIEAAAEGDTITILKDITVNGVITFSKNLTLRTAEGVTITKGANVEGDLFIIPKNVQLTIEGVEKEADGVKVPTFTIVGNDKGRIASVKADGTLTIKNATLKSSGNNNTSGGAILNQGILEVRNSEFRDNTGNNGGALQHQGPSAKFYDTGFKSNTANNRSGAIDINIKDADAEFYGCTFEENVAKTTGSYGSALYANQELDIKFAGCTFKNNYSYNWGGAIAFNQTTTRVVFEQYNGKNSVFENNYSKKSAGNKYGETSKLAVYEKAFSYTASDKQTYKYCSHIVSQSEITGIEFIEVKWPQAN